MQQFGKCDNYWIGAKRSSNGNFTWSDNNKFSYNNFKTGNNNDPTKGCISIIEQTTFWQTSDCSDKNCFICEKPDPSNLPNFATYSDCQELKEAGETKSGMYFISTKNGPKKVYCEMEIENGGWVVIQQRVDGSLEFWNQKWSAYKQGFGLLGEASNFWLGNDLIHELSSKDLKVILRIELWGDQNPASPYKNDYWWSEFNFELEDETSDYTLHASILQRYPNDYTGTGNASTNWYDVTCEEGVKFSTIDKINDPMKKCVTDYHLG
uniref:Fibrinogen C-terminal domain-containing protein n=1 Tax=Panagrolaimus davidi TaxID=227884 RepID=A0A914QGU2_9BILA